MKSNKKMVLYIEETNKQTKTD